MSPIEVILLMLVGALTGYILRNRSLEYYTKLSELIKFLAIDLLLPVFLFSAFLLKGSPKDLVAFLMGASVPFISLLAGYLVFRGHRYQREGMVLSFFGNITILGLPIVKSLNLPEAPALASISGYNLVYLSITPFLATFDPDNLKEGFKRAISNPILLAFLSAMIVKIIDLLLNQVITLNLEGVLRLLRLATEPSLYLMAFYFGLKIDFRELDLDFTLRVLIAKMLIPFLILLAIKYTLSLQLDERLFKVILVTSTMPPAILANAFISQYGLNESKSYTTTIALTIIALGWLLVGKVI